MDTHTESERGGMIYVCTCTWVCPARARARARVCVF